MFLIYRFVMTAVMFVQMWINSSLVKLVFTDTHWSLMLLWWVFSPGSQVLMYFLGRDGSLSIIEMGFVLILAFVEVLLFGVAIINKD